MHIQIPNPCHENWDNMKPCEKGRHCGVCKKDVVDMDKLHPVHAIQHLSHARQQVCGRISSKRLGVLNQLVDIVNEQKPDWKNAAAMLVASAGVMIGQHADAQALPEMPPDTLEYAKAHPNDGLIHISGTLTDSITRKPLIGATVSAYADGIFLTGVTSDIDGKYQMQLDPKKLQNCVYSILFNMAGYKDGHISRIEPNRGSFYYPIALFSDITGDVVGKKIISEMVGSMVVTVEVVKSPISIERAMDFLFNGPSLLNR